MKASFKSILLLLFACCVSSFGQTAIYLDSSVTNGGEGGINSPYKTLAQIENLPTTSATLDIYLKRGSTFTQTKTFVLRSRDIRFHAYGSGAKPIVDCVNGTVDGFRFQDPAHVLLEDLVVTRCSAGFRFLGFCNDVIVRRCEVRQQLDPAVGAFMMDGTATTVSGRADFYDCSVYQSDGDGFQSHGTAYMYCYRCTAQFCGGLWTTPYAVPTKPVRTRIVYVDPVSGSDSNDGLSEGRPLQTATAVASVSVAGDEIRLKRNTTLTTGLPLALKAHQTVAGYGYGARATFKPTNTSTNAFSLADVEDVRFEEVRIASASDALSISGACPDLVLANVVIEQSNNGVKCSNTTTGTISIYGCIFDTNTVNAIKVDNAAKLKAYDTKFIGNAGSSTGAAVASAGASATVECRACVFDGNGVNQVSLAANAGANLIHRCWFSRTTQATGTDMSAIRFAPASAASASDPSLLVANSLITLPNPAASKDHKGVTATQAVSIWNCSFWDDNAGTNTRTSYAVRVDTAALSLKNCIFESVGSYSGIFFVRGDATCSNVTADYNKYFDTGAAPSRWSAAGTSKSFAQWGAFASVNDDVTGAYTTSRMMRQQLTSPFDATHIPSTHWQEATCSGASAFDLTAAGTGANLTTAMTTAGWPECVVDFGGRTHGLSGNWLRGFCELVNFSPDGFTNHATGHLKMVGCSASYCEDGYQSIHLATTPDMGENAIIDSSFSYCYQDGVSTFWPAAIGDVTVVRCSFESIGEFAVHVIPQSGHTQTEDGCFFSNCSNCINSNGAGSDVVRNCTFLLPARTDATTAYGVWKNTTAGSLTVQNSSFVLSPYPTETSEYFGVWNSAGGNGTLTLNNNVFVASDLSAIYYVKLNATPSSAQISEADYDFYWQVATAGNRTKWYNGGAISFATWQGYNKGTSAAATDNSGAHTTTQITEFPAEEHRLSLGASAYYARRYGPAWALGKNLKASFRTDQLGGVRGDTGAWPVGPGPYVPSAGGVFRDGNRIVFSNVVLDALVNTDIKLATGWIGGDPTQRVKISSMQLYHSAGTTFTLSEGPLFDERALLAGYVPTSGFVGGPWYGTPGRDLFLSFAGTSGTISGEVVCSIEAAPATAGAGPARAGIKAQ